MGSSRAFAASRCRRPDFPSACRGSPPRLQHLGKLDSKPEPGPVVVTVFDKDRLAEYQNMVGKLRAANIRAELYLGNPRNLGNQLKYADKRNAPCVVIQGTDEKAKGEVTIKDLIVGAELAKLEKGREEHLQKQAEAQFAVAEEKLVDAVRAGARPPRPQFRVKSFDRQKWHREARG